jgi:hypothetical protein
MRDFAQYLRVENNMNSHVQTFCSGTDWYVFSGLARFKCLSAEHANALAEQLRKTTEECGRDDHAGDD